MDIKSNLAEVENKIVNACKKAGRDRSEVRLIAVSKTKPVEVLQEVYDENIRYFGENKVQELSDKIPKLPSDIKWHFIGHLQRNKVKYIIGKVDLIHSVDSLRLAKQIDDDSKKNNLISNILIQVNVSNESTKFGTSNEEVFDLIKAVSELENIRVKGLMTIAPATNNPEECRVYFKKLKELSTEIEKLNLKNVEMKELSMGMTGDYEIAIEEGATLVRVGTGIFGERVYS
ncbi:MAG: YggS family pyridoxal phosphate-dependent enzyme [Parasporobacterium sp.]|nr:YggS family pyridoxal phosphate-dependent enzyme [Parasporobacterium sp.]